MKKAEIIKNGNVNLKPIEFNVAPEWTKITLTDWDKLKSEFFKEFGKDSFRGYPLEQCHLIFDWFKKRLS